MDADRETYRREMARRGRTPAAAAEQRGTELRELFLDRLSAIRQDRSLRDFGDAVGIPHTTVHSWYLDPRSQPNLLHLQAIADRAELPGVPRGLLSLDWLCGLSDEPSRNTRVEAEQLPAQLATYVEREAIAKAGPPIDGGFRETLRLSVFPQGGTLLQFLVDRLVEDLRDMEASYCRRRQEQKEIQSIRRRLAAAEGVGVALHYEIMRALHSHQPLPSGKLITWTVNPAPVTASATKKQKPRKRARR